jgi:DNA-binding winged helix-turn-helix (wHTH) protein
MANLSVREDFGADGGPMERAPAYPDQDGDMRFRAFRVFSRSRTLLCEGRPVDIGGRAFDLLLVLLNARGEIVSKEEITRRVWPTTLVDESNLRFQVASLRKALGRDRDLIKTVSGRGYLFVAEAVGEEAADPAAPRSDGSRPRLAIVTANQVVPFAEPRSLEGDQAAQQALIESREACEALRYLLQSVLDELRRRPLQVEGGVYARN